MDKLAELVDRAKTIVAGENNPDRASLWRAYVALEYAILDLKLRHGIEGQQPPKPAGKQVVDIAQARSMLAKLDLSSSSDKKKLLYDLRSCRDMVKAIVAGYDRRSMTS
ncbi:MAG: hypothetical protein HRF40_00250 [Nitrososphaera sp.]